MAENLTSKKALIFGISGQDGSYLADFLLRRGYGVWGVSRRPGPVQNLNALGIAGKVCVLACDMQDALALRRVLDDVAPDEIYHLAGQSSVSYSFAAPVETMHSIAHSTLNLLEAVRLRGEPARLFHASSAECFGDHGVTPVTETTPFRPKSPYGVAKASAHWQVACFREAFGLYACSGILFNHESPLRPRGFVTQKVIAAVAAIARGSTDKLHLGAIDVVRDWGWAPEYVQAMWLMLQQRTADDFIIATGESYSLREFVDTAFAAIGAASADFLVQDDSLFRPAEIKYSYADARKVTSVLGWSATSRMKDVVRLMLASDAAALQDKQTASGMPTRHDFLNQ